MKPDDREKRRDRDFDKALGAEIRRLRITFGVSQADLGKMVGLSAQQIQKYELAHTAMDASMMTRLALILDTPPADVLAAAMAGTAPRPERYESRDALALLASYKQLTPERQKAVRIVAHALKDEG